ncbi:MAG: MazG nucleotide pyrophosphohydrolase domain-containing protein [Nanoarchaeota archaeon]
MNDFQKRIRQFADERNWHQFHNPKDLLLGIVEEVGEIRNIVKWEQDKETLRKVLLANKEELEDNIGDMYWFMALLANGADVNIDAAIDKVIRKNETRFPVKKVKSQHTNLYLGGTDGQYDKQQPL